MTWSWKSELPSWLMLAAMWILLAFAWPDAPERIPTHWNLRGEVDRMGGRFTGLMLLPITAVAIYLMLRFLPMIDPARANYDKFRTAYGVIRHGTLVMMAAIYALTIAIIRGASIDMSLAIASLVGVFFVAVGLVTPGLKRNWFFGLRTPWTLNSDVAWDRAHRIFGWTMVATGVAIVAAGWTRSAPWLFVVIGVLVAGMLAATWVSYTAWRDDPARAKGP
ncbi:MAG TPA: SdpI family protein [Acidobacteriota bacterium]|nr:SdpI family protein [Acidobacteriota bacterium]